MTMTPTQHVTDFGYRLFKAFMNRIWYPFLTRRLDAEEVTFLNYGYEQNPPLSLPLKNPMSRIGMAFSCITRPPHRST